MSFVANFIRFHRELVNLLPIFLCILSRDFDETVAMDATMSKQTDTQHCAVAYAHSASRDRQPCTNCERVFHVDVSLRFRRRRR